VTHPLQRSYSLAVVDRILDIGTHRGGHSSRPAPDLNQAVADFLRRMHQPQLGLRVHARDTVERLD
jgi:hypothetical protein